MAERTEFERQLRDSMNLTWVSSEDIYIDPKIQRDVTKRQKQFSYIMARYNIDLAQPITVAHINGRLQCIDGQMTLATMLAQNAGRPLEVPCRMLRDMTEDEASHMFYLQRGAVAALVSDDVIKLEYFNPGSTDSGMDVQGAQKAIAKEGYTYGYEDDGLTKILAKKAITNEYSKFNNDEEYQQIFRIINKAWGESSRTCQKHIIEGLGYFIRVYAGKFDEDVLAKKLSKQSLQHILSEAKRKKMFKSLPKCEALEITIIYNDRRKTNRLDVTKLYAHEE